MGGLLLEWFYNREMLHVDCCKTERVNTATYRVLIGSKRRAVLNA